MDKTTRRKIIKEMEDLTNSVNQQDLRDIYRTLHSTTTFSRPDHILGHKTNPNKFKRTEII